MPRSSDSDTDASSDSIINYCDPIAEITVKIKFGVTEFPLAVRNDMNISTFAEEIANHEMFPALGPNEFKILAWYRGELCDLIHGELRHFDVRQNTLITIKSKHRGRPKKKVRK